MNEGKKTRTENMLIEDRIMFLMNLRSKGIKTTPDLFHFYSEEYNLTQRTFYNDLKKVNERIKENFAIESEEGMTEILADLRVLYNKNFQLKDYRECRTILKTISEITGWNHKDMIKQADSPSEDKKELGGLAKMIARKGKKAG